MKLERLLAIVMLLLNRKQVSAAELAKHFEVSPRTIYRDIEAINQAGIPIVSSMGAEGGFRILDTYRLDRTVLTPDDIDSIVTALKGARTTLAAPKISNTLEKVKTLLSEKELDKVEKNIQRIFIDYSSWSSVHADKTDLRTLLRAIDEGKVVEFDYFSNKEETTHRCVEPLTLVFKDFAWYLHGYCRLRSDFRLFRVNRMTGLCLTGERFHRENVPVDSLTVKEEWFGGAPLIDIVLRFTARVRLKVLDEFRSELIHFNADGTSLVRFKIYEDDGMYKLLLSFGADVEVLEPVDLRQRLRERALAIAALYE